MSIEIYFSSFRTRPFEKIPLQTRFVKTSPNLQRPLQLTVLPTLWRDRYWGVSSPSSLSLLLSPSLATSHTLQSGFKEELKTNTEMASDYLNGPGFNSEYKLVYSTNEDAQPLGVFAICDVAPWDFGKAKEANISEQMVLVFNPYHQCRLYHSCSVYFVSSPPIQHEEWWFETIEKATLLYNLNSQVSFLTFFIFNFDADRQYKDQEKLQQLEDEYQVSLFVEECTFTNQLTAEISDSCGQIRFGEQPAERGDPLLWGDDLLLQAGGGSRDLGRSLLPSELQRARLHHGGQMFWIFRQDGVQVQTSKSLHLILWHNNDGSGFSWTWI